jgi:hypothetical protein
MDRITLLSPGHKPPQVTMSQASFAGSKNISGTRCFKTRRTDAFVKVRPDITQTAVQEYMFLITRKPQPAYGRGNGTISESVRYEIL